jgi:hypothetical protein
VWFRGGLAAWGRGACGALLGSLPWWLALLWSGALRSSAFTRPGVLHQHTSSIFFAVVSESMRERDLQAYHFENLDVPFPNQVINRKRREVFIEGRRIDLLFEVDGVQYIVELKRDTIRREDIGQLFEYYELMRRPNETVR